VRIASGGLYAYPDVVVVRGEARFDDDQRDTVLNPTLLVEVLSASTEAYDRGDTFAHYRKLDSLADYRLIAQDRIHAEQFVRRAAQ
jgi:Uma2 family endonuclease